MSYLESFHEFFFGLFSDVNLDAVVEEVVVLESGMVLLSLLLGGLAVDRRTLQVVFFVNLESQNRYFNQSL